jgi:exodeoxyribonuclease VII large subunit
MNGDLFDPPPPPPPRSGRPARRAAVRSAQGWNLEAAAAEAFSVTAVNTLAREALEGVVPPLWVHGEVTGWKRHPSGHCYFGLRDARSQLRAVMFRLDAQRIPTDPAEGMKLRAFGTVTLYEKRGEYQFVVRELEAQGAGGLWRLAFDRLRAKLDAEGLLAPERKRPLPRHPMTVGVVTSPVGAALQDILQVIRARAPWTRVRFAPAKVQGEGAAHSLARAVRMFRRRGMADVLIVGRGGGSVEDLWAFNEEVLARAIVACPIPVISAVGHEVDVTIADLVADHRAPTPSAAAERAVPDRAAVGREIAVLEARLGVAARRMHHRRSMLVADLRVALEDRIGRNVTERRTRLGRVAEKLNALSPLGALQRGYAVPLAEDGSLLRRVGDFTPGRRVRLRVVDGAVPCRVEGSEDGRNE